MAKFRMNWCKSFLKQKLEQRGFTPETVSGNLYNLNVFSRYLKEKSINDIRQVDKNRIRNYIDYLKDYQPKAGTGGRLADESLWNLVRSLKLLFHHLLKDDLVFNDPFRNIKKPKSSKHLPRNILSVEEIDKLLDLPDTGTYLGFRDRTIMEVLYGTGLRLGELLNLNSSDIDFRERMLFVRQGKGRKDRIVTCSKVGLMYLKEYMEGVRGGLSYLNDKQTALFLTDNGRRLKKGGFETMLKKYVKKSGIKKHVTAHCFRHTFATHLLEKGANVRYIQEILGHSSLSTTAIYARVGIVRLQEEHEKYHPVNNEWINELNSKLNNELNSELEICMKQIRKSQKVLLTRRYV